MQELIETLSKLENKPIFKKRESRSMQINDQLAHKLSLTLNKIKGRIDSEIGESGELDIDEFIDFRINKRVGVINNFEIFNDITESNGLEIHLLIDCSGSMRNIDSQLRNTVGTIFKGLESCPFITFKVKAFSAKAHEFQSVIDNIESVKDCSRIQSDDHDYHDIQSLAINNSVKELIKSESKKMIIIITDGYPEGYFNGKKVDSETMNNLMNRSINNARNNDIEVFCLFYNHIRETTDLIRKLFNNNMFESRDFKDIEIKLIEALEKAVMRINEGSRK